MKTPKPPGPLERGSLQTRKLERFPLIAVGGEFWDKSVAFVSDTLLREGTISLEDLQFIHRVDTAEDVVGVIRKAGLMPA